MNSLWDIRIFLGLVPKESHCSIDNTDKNATVIEDDDNAKTIMQWIMVIVLWV